MNSDHYDLILSTIISDNIRNKFPVNNPVVIILGAQPGAGKTELEKISRAELGDNVISCNADLFRDYHPDTLTIKANHEEHYPELTAGYAQAWNKGLREYCEANRLNYILETTFSSGEAMNETIADLKEKGYRVNIKLLAVHPRLSLLGTHLRFEEMKASEGHGRIVGQAAHDERFYKLFETLERVQSASLFDQLDIYKRNYSPSDGVFIDSLELVARDPEDALTVFVAEVTKTWSEEQQLFFRQACQQVIHQMENRLASSQEIDEFKERMNFPYENSWQASQGEQTKAEQVPKYKTGR